ncbi:DUF4249 domain-containing protein [Algoriphagus namhaensis]|uniref:DUF4249 domain-containing protein n=1 Tax=Algoriphagus namhaensis TaxID=915353 RepID=A0ABV8AQN9_9BACT
MKGRLLLLLVLLGLSVGCREPFEPEIAADDQNILVVAGYLDSDGLPSVLTLSTTTSIGDDGFFPDFTPLFGADIFLESSSGQRFPLLELENGQYLFETDIDESDTYRLRILLRNGNSYTSEELKPVITPDIIDVSFVKNETGVEVFLTTQGDENADDFLWTYEETWSFRPAITTQWEYDPETQDVVLRDPEDRIDLCYRSERNSDLILETSSRFEDQFVFRQSIAQIDQGDEKLSTRYSILISQKALSKSDVEFWEILKRNSDDLGSIFSPLPSLVGGNIELDQNPEVPVIGQVSLGKVRQKRLFIDRQEISPWSVEVPEYAGCILSADTVLVADYDLLFKSGVNIPSTPIYPENAFNPIGFRYGSINCVDCTIRGTNIKPSFWED